MFLGTGIGRVFPRLPDPSVTQIISDDTTQETLTLPPPIYPRVLTEKSILELQTHTCLQFFRGT